jgi:uncharacterized protein (TIGR04222 family)
MVAGSDRLMRAGVAVAMAIAGLALVHAAPDEGWRIERMAIELDIAPDASVTAREAIDVDFRGLQRHGILRDLDDRLIFDGTHDRRYVYALQSVTTADGRPHRAKVESIPGKTRFRIGDPAKTISGRESYRLAYTIRGALNAFADHDELYWNATGAWPVTMDRASIVVRAPAGAIQRVTCFQGGSGSSEPCAAERAGDGASATFAATRPLAENEQVTIVAALRKGTVAEPAPILVARPRGPDQFFDRSPLIDGLTAAGFVAVIAGLAALWWRVGRDRRYISLHYLSQDTAEERVPLFGADPVAVEFEPPERIRPAQIGLLLDETADTLDITATIVDLASRGYLRITELEKTGWFGKTDWQIDKLKSADDGLLEYERIVFDGLFDAGPSRKLSDLKEKFYSALAKAKRALYRDAVDRKWFPRNPNAVRTAFVVLGLFVMFAGVGLAVVLGQSFGAAPVALPVIAGGLLLAIFSRAMPRRTAAGREMMRRALGFARYIRTAEVRQQAFAERANIFTAYLPYAIALRCVDKWARAFKDIDLQQATAGWYVGTSPFNPTMFAAHVGSFSSSVSSAIASTPGGSGGSGFSGGSSGGGGGGGGGGSW